MELPKSLYRVPLFFYIEYSHYTEYLYVTTQSTFENDFCTAPSRCLYIWSTDYYTEFLQVTIHYLESHPVVVSTP
jgi:hypothetical protein